MGTWRGIQISCNTGVLPKSGGSGTGETTVLLDIRITRPMLRYRHRHHVPVRRRLQLEHRDLRPAPIQHALAVGQPAVDVQVPALDGVVAVRVVAISVRVKPLAELARRDL